MAGVLLFAVLMTATAFFGTAVVVFEASGAYSSGEEAFVENLVISEACHRAEDLLNSNALWYDDDATRYDRDGLRADTKAQEDSGFFYRIKDERGKTIFSNYDKGQEYTYTCRYEGGAATADIYINTDTAGDSKAKSLEILAYNIGRRQRLYFMQSYHLYLRYLCLHFLLPEQAGEKAPMRSENALQIKFRVMYTLWQQVLLRQLLYICVLCHFRQCMNTEISVQFSV